MKNVLIILFCNLTSVCFAQTDATYDCDILQSAIESEVFQEDFSVAKFHSHQIVIIDTNYYFNCQQMSAAKKDVVFERELKYKVNQVNGIESQNKIVILYLKEGGIACKTFTIHFWRPKNNAILTLEIIKNKGHLGVKLLDSGSL